MAFHDIPRYTKDTDILGLPNDVEGYHRIMDGLGYSIGGAPWAFKGSAITMHRFIKPGDDEDFIVVDFLIGNLPKHSEIIERAVLDDSFIGKVRLASREDLIALKLLRNSDQDQVDIKRLKGDKDRKIDQGGE